MTVEYVEVGNAITITYDPLMDGWPAVIAAIEASSTLVDVVGNSSDDLTHAAGGQLADGVDAFTPTVIGRGTFTEYTANSGIFCPNVTLGAARTGDKAKAATGLSSASESAYSSAAASWTPTKRTVPAEANVLTGSGTYGDLGVEFTPSYAGSAIPAFQAPGLSVVDDGDGSVTCTITGNKLVGDVTNQTSRLKYRKASASSWTVHGTSITGNGTITDLTGLEKGISAEAYIFQLVPYDSTSGAEGAASAPFPLHLADSTAAADTSELDDEMADSCAEVLAEQGRALTYNAYGVTPVVTTGLIVINQSVGMDTEGRQEVIHSGTIRLPATVATAAERRDTFTIDGETYACEAPPHRPAGGWVRFQVRRMVRVMQGAGKTRG